MPSLQRPLRASSPTTVHHAHLTLLACLAAGACSLSPDLPFEPPPLADMEEPLDLRAEPDDEALRQRLPRGTFAGFDVDDARDTLAAKLGEPAGGGMLRITRVVENSPAAAAGLEVDDVLLEATVDGGAAVALARPSDWRRIELEAPAGAEVSLLVDRAGREATTKLRLVERVRPPARQPVERYREEQRIGAVLRTATEVEARAAGLPPGGGAVVVGLSQRSPWRTVGVRFGDLIAAIDDVPVRHPQDVLLAARDPARETLRLTVRRGETTFGVAAPLTSRDQDLREVSLPLLFSYRDERGKTEWSMLLGILNYQSTEAAWRFRLLWLIGFGAGDSERLLEVGS
jgi:hypothetical protein